MDVPRAFDYADFRKFLEDWFIAAKAHNVHFTHRVLAQRMGTNDPSALANVISHRRRLAAGRLEALVRALELKGDEAEYFRLLVQFGQARSREERDRSWSAIAELRSRLSEPKVDATRFTYLSRWIYPAVRELAQCRRFEARPDWIARHLRPRVSESDAAEALDVNVRLGFLVRENGKLVPRDPEVRTSPIVTQLASYAYHQQNHRLAGEALDRLFPPAPGATAETAFLGLTLAIPDHRIPELRRMLWELQSQIMAQTDAWRTEWDRVVQLNIQLFPVSSRTDEE
jgi:uncharacterized protein (TIGR02147 family)